LAPGYKRRAKFMFFTENCRVRRSHLADFEKQLSPILVGQLRCIVSFLPETLNEANGSRPRSRRGQSHELEAEAETRTMNVEAETEANFSRPRPMPKL